MVYNVPLTANAALDKRVRITSVFLLVITPLAALILQKEPVIAVQNIPDIRHIRNVRVIVGLVQMALTDVMMANTAQALLIMALYLVILALLHATIPALLIPAMELILIVTPMEMYLPAIPA